LDFLRKEGLLKEKLLEIESANFKYGMSIKMANNDTSYKSDILAHEMKIRKINEDDRLKTQYLLNELKTQ
jgi:hypothetical protein